MPTLLFKLTNVPEDEAEEVRELLTEHGIDFYETEAGRWGISVAGIWVKDESQVATARELIDRYQHERGERVRAAYEAKRRAGEHETMASRFMHHPIRFILYLLGILVIFYFTVMPFLDWG
ncbi:DUF6164 family protein [Thiohalomonas denitrificans]|uniref:Signal transducing protein n=1 Tax=Thiohalomonas denitrificans TaxID=415747 RepID=A0A1G5QX53_9GAMM|nr:DUF6164 family protein [Thiohalomonas denitrificans]SCZ66423.1 hypothetical protein SAMN03097708_02963 [Thiohalomonas denitrificans]